MYCFGEFNSYARHIIQKWKIQNRNYQLQLLFLVKSYLEIETTRMIMSHKPPNNAILRESDNKNNRIVCNMDQWNVIKRYAVPKNCDHFISFSVKEQTKSVC